MINSNARPTSTNVSIKIAGEWKPASEVLEVDDLQLSNPNDLKSLIESAKQAEGYENLSVTLFYDSDRNAEFFGKELMNNIKSSLGLTGRVFYNPSEGELSPKVSYQEESSSSSVLTDDFLNAFM